MFLLHVDMKIKPGLQQALEKTYVEVFRPAISRQEGFSSVDLLRPTEDGVDYRLSLAFENQASQEKWVSTELHQQVWPQMESMCQEYVVKSFNVV